MSRNSKRIDLSSSTSKSGSSGSGRPPSLHEVRSDPWGKGGSRAAGIKFGSPSNNRGQPASASYSWSTLLSKAARGGLSRAFGGGGIMGTLGGLGGIVSHIVGLFGSKSKTPPPLSLFRLPDSQAQTMSLNSSANTGQAHGAIYNTPAQQASLQYHSADIAQAVKQALLTSSSLNDVIAEL